jgi:thiamine-phosphate pyrophosphorylase
MAANQPSWPRQWLMTDERIGERLWEAIDRLPAGRGGIVFRHYSLSPDERSLVGARLAAAARERKLVLAVAGSALLAGQLGAALHHNPAGSPDLPVSLSVHDEAEAARASEIGAALVFISPVHGTRSHPGALSLGADRAAELARLVHCPAIALGGMNAARFDALDQAHPGLFYGFAGIDCWLSESVTK